MGGARGSPAPCAQYSGKRAAAPRAPPSTEGRFVSMARSRLVAGVVVVAALVVGGWLALTRSGAEDGRLALDSAARAAPQAPSFADTPATLPDAPGEAPK